MVFLGADRARKLQRLQELERRLEVDPLDRHRLDGASVTLAELLAFCRQRPAAGRVRLVAVDDAHRLPKGTIDALGEHVEAIRACACVVLLSDAEAGPRSSSAGPWSVETFPERDAASAKPFALADALGSRDVRAALQALHDQQRDGKEPIEIVGLLAWQLGRWVLVKRMLGAGARGANPAALASALKMSAWQLERVQAEIHGRTLGSLQELLERCWRLDVELKRGGTVPGVALEELIVSICLSGREGSVRR